MGHEMFTPTLTGLGERAHLLSRDVGLATHVQDLVGVLTYEDLRDAVLVAHSYGGNVAYAALEAIDKRVAALVLLDANMVRSGESLFDLMPPSAVRSIRQLAEDRGDGWKVPPVDATYWGISDQADIAWVKAMTTPHHRKGYTDPVGPTTAAWTHPGMFIECRSAHPSNVRLDRPRDRGARDPTFSYRLIESAHDATITAPDLVIDCLLDALDI
jgi:pimeloyl-ACP methyl ester carboxylesterase